jgi:LmbE family N-acetylglucosaminyl deacetylase
MRDFARPAIEELDRLVVVSPHLDDAVLGCGQLLSHHPGAMVVTVFGGRPEAYPDEVTGWDAIGGFKQGDDVVAIRREEDRSALAVFDASPVWLEFADHQYVPEDARDEADEVAEALDAVLVELDPTAVFFPFGLANPDHVMTHRATRSLIDRHPDWAWFCYEDSGYKHIPGMLAWRVSSLFRRKLWPTPAVIAVDPSRERKLRALACYASQLPPLFQNWGLTDQLEAPVPEQYWRLAPPPPGWEAIAGG